MPNQNKLLPVDKKYEELINILDPSRIWNVFL